jgi:hypothetical protein
MLLPIAIFNFQLLKEKPDKSQKCRMAGNGVKIMKRNYVLLEVRLLLFLSGCSC